MIIAQHIAITNRKMLDLAIDQAERNRAEFAQEATLNLRGFQHKWTVQRLATMVTVDAIPNMVDSVTSAIGRDSKQSGDSSSEHDTTWSAILKGVLRRVLNRFVEKMV